MSALQRREARGVFDIEPFDDRHDLMLDVVATRLHPDDHNAYRLRISGMDAAERAEYDREVGRKLIEAHNDGLQYRIVGDLREGRAVVVDPKMIGNATPEPFPIEVFPPVVRDMIESESRAIQTSIDLPAMVALGLAATIANHRQLAVQSGSWRQRCNLYLVVALPPGAGKSPVFKRMSEPVEQFANDLEQRSKADIVKLMARKELLKKKVDHAGNKLRGPTPTPEDEKAYEAAISEHMEYEVPSDPYTLYGGTDMTQEAFKDVLRSNGGTMSIISDEGGFFSNLSRYLKPGQTPEMDGVLHSWDGGTVSVTKVSKKYKIKNAHATMMFCVQPIVLRQLLGNDVMVGRGLADRFMCCAPPSLVGERDFIHEHERDLVAGANYDEFMAKLCAVDFKGATIHASEGARRLFAQWRQKNENRIYSGEYGDIPGMIAKVNASTMRVAGLLHLLWGDSDRTELSEVRMGQAIAVGEYWLAHALRIIAENYVDHVDSGALKMLEWMQRQDSVEFTMRDLCRGGATKRSHGSAVADIKPLVKRMLEYGWISTSDELWESPIRDSEPTTFCVLVSDSVGQQKPHIANYATDRGNQDHSLRNGVGQSDSRTVLKTTFEESSSLLISQGINDFESEDVTAVTGLRNERPNGVRLSDKHERKVVIGPVDNSDDEPEPPLVRHEITGAEIRRDGGGLL